MNVKSALALSNALDRPALIVDRAGTVRACTHVMRETLGFDETKSRGATLHSLVIDSAASVDRLLRRAASTGDPLPGRLSFRQEEDSSLQCRVYASRIPPDLVQGEKLMLLRCERPEDSTASNSFAVLNSKIDQLGREIARRRQTEAIQDAETALLGAIADGATLPSAMSAIVKVADADRPAVRTVILPLDLVRRRILEPVGLHIPAAFTKRVRRTKLGPEAGPVWRAASAGQLEVVADFDSDEMLKGIASDQPAEAARRCWVTPVLDSQHQALAVLIVHGELAEEPSPGDLIWMANFVRLAQIAIERHSAVVEREALIEEARAAQYKAEAMNRAKDEFLAMLGHELRNPLAAINTSALGLRAQNGRQESSESLIGIILRQGDHLRSIVSDLLDVARVSSGQFVIKRSDVELGSIISGCVEDTIRNLEGLQRHIEVATELVWVSGDPVRIEQVATNLLENAVKYTPEHGSIWVTLEAEGDEAVLRIRDDGVGLQADFLTKAFDLFSQGPQKIDRGGGGLGIGLTLVKKVVEMHGGRVAAKSAGSNRGSEFEVRLPRIQEPGSTDTPALTTTDAAQKRRSVLLVEDDDDVRMAMRALLEAWGNDVSEMADGLSGLEFAMTYEPDLILVDIGLPGLDGYEFAREYRKRIGEQGATLVAVTGYGHPEDRARALGAGFDSHLVKPISADELRAVLDQQRR